MLNLSKSGLSNRGLNCVGRLVFAQVLGRRVLGFRHSEIQGSWRIRDLDL